MGIKVNMRPKIPLCLAEDEPQCIERICVAPTVPKCLVAIFLFSTIYVYRTVKPVAAYCSYNVADVKITSEKWLLKPTSFVLVETLNDDIIRILPSGSRGVDNLSVLKQQRSHYRTIKSFLNDNGSLKDRANKLLKKNKK